MSSMSVPFFRRCHGVSGRTIKMIVPGHRTSCNSSSGGSGGGKFEGSVDSFSCRRGGALQNQKSATIHQTKHPFHPWCFKYPFLIQLTLPVHPPSHPMRLLSVVSYLCGPAHTAPDRAEAGSISSKH